MHANPPSVEYSLTPLGHSLLGPLSALADWAVEYQPQIAAARAVRHDAHTHAADRDFERD
ncbi:winged helix-turn-helix transcriptional regulator [Nocardia sp. NPDC004123]